METAREALDVARHGLRVRFRLTSDQYSGAVVAEALPYVLGSILGLCGCMLYLMFRGGMNDHREVFSISGEIDRYGDTVSAYAPVPVLVAAAALAAAALVGWWSWARWFAVATIVGAAVTIVAVFELRDGRHIYVLTTFPGFEMPLMLAAFAAMVLAVPTDARTLAGRRILTAAVALAVTGSLALAWVREGFAWSLITAMPGVVAAVVVVALAVGLVTGQVTRQVAGPRHHLLPGAVALACAPWLTQAFTGDVYDIGYSGTRYVLLVGLAIVLVLAVGSRRGQKAVAERRPDR